MSMSIDVRINQEITPEALVDIISNAAQWEPLERNQKWTCGRVEGASVTIVRKSPRGRALCLEMYGIEPIMLIGFAPDKFKPYEISHGAVFDCVVALVKSTQGDLVAAEGDYPFLRRVEGRVTLYDDGEIFSPEVRPQWRQKFDLPHEYRETFER
jgi:hypothetical protein